MGAALALATALCAVPFVARFLTAPAPVAMLAAFGTLTVLPTLVVLAVSAATRHRTSAVAAAALALAQLTLLIPQVTSDPAPDGTRLTVMTVNLNLGAAEAAAVVAAVRRHGVQVLAVQELTVEAERRLEAAGLGATLPYKATDPGGSASGTGLWASRPLERLEPWEMTFRSSAAALTVAGRRVVGAGVVRTWSPRRGIPPLLDLDHVLVPGLLGAGRHEVVDVAGSDHEGVVAELVVPPG